MENEDKIAAFWQAFLDTLPPDSPLRRQSYVAESFGDSPELADELVALILSGAKTATCSSLWEWEEDGEPLPQPGMITIVLDGQELPRCIIETTEVQVRPFNQVDERFASDEGEGDRSLAYWREAHLRYFRRVLPEIGRQPAQDMPLVCERFKVIYQR